MKTSVEKSETTYVLRLNEKELAYFMACTGVFIDRTDNGDGVYADLVALAEGSGAVGIDDKYYKVEASENPIIKDAGVDRVRSAW